MPQVSIVWLNAGLRSPSNSGRGAAAQRAERVTTMLSFILFLLMHSPVYGPKPHPPVHAPMPSPILPRPR